MVAGPVTMTRLTNQLLIKIILLFFLLSQLLIFTLATSQLSHHCKKTLRDAFEICKSGRNKRSLILDVLRPALTPVSSTDYQPGVIEESESRREITIREIIVSSRIPIHALPSTTRDYPSTPRIYSSTTSDASNGNQPIVVPPDEPSIKYLPEENGSDVGFEITYEEMDELFNQYLRGSRTSRRSRAEAESDFNMSVMRCCSDRERCLRNGVLGCGS